MLNKKKMLSVMLAASLLTALTAGCKEKGKSSEFNDKGVYVPGEKLELTVWETQGTDYAPVPVEDGDVVAQWLEEKTNVTVKDMYGNDGGQWDPKLTKLVAGDNLPDIVHCGAFQGPAHFSKLNELGQVWELTPEMIQKYAPNVWERTPEEYWEAIKVDGKIFGIPYACSMDKKVYPGIDDETYTYFEDNFEIYETDVTFLANQTLWIRDDILQKFYPEAKTYDELCALVEEKNAPIGDELLDIPIKSTEEFVDFMYDIKNSNLKEGDKKIYATGYGGGDNWIALTWLGADMYGYKNHSYTGTWNDVEEKIEIPLVHDTIRQAAKTQNEMINDGVIDPESLAHTTAQFKEKIMNGQYAIVPLSYVGGPEEINKELEKSGKSFRYRPFITQVPAQKQYGAFTENTLWGESLCMLKTLSEEEVHQVLNWINVQYSDEFEQVRYWGPEEAGLYTEDENGKRVFKDEKLNKYFIEGDQSAISDDSEKLGLQGNAGLMLVSPSPYMSVWEPRVIHRSVKFEPTSYSGFKFSKDSEHVKAVKQYPPCQVWSSVYADVPEVITFWSEREQWESKFKIALAASKDEFDSKWDGAIESLNAIVEIEALENAMTEVAKPLAEKVENAK